MLIISAWLNLSSLIRFLWLIYFSCWKSFNFFNRSCRSIIIYRQKRFQFHIIIIIIIIFTFWINPFSRGWKRRPRYSLNSFLPITKQHFSRTIIKISQTGIESKQSNAWWKYLPASIRCSWSSRVKSSFNQSTISDPIVWILDVFVIYSDLVLIHYLKIILV